MNSEMMAKLRGLIEEAATGKCNMTAEGKMCPIHENKQCPGYIEEIASAGMSDTLAAKKIAAKIMGTPDLNMPKIKQHVKKYLSMVGKAPTDVDYIAALVASELENKGVMESKKKIPDDDGDGVPNWADKNPGKDDRAGKKTKAKGEMTAKQAKYFGKKKTVKESQEFSPELQALMQKYGIAEDDSMSEHFFFPDTRSRQERNRDENKPQDKLSARQPGDVAKYGDDYKYMTTGKSADAKRMNALYRAGGPKGPLPEDAGSKYSPELQALMKKYGVAEDATNATVDEDIHITVDGPEAQEMINRLMTLAGQDTMSDSMPSMADDDMCNDCGSPGGNCTCNHNVATSSFGPLNGSMEENIDHDYGHTAHSDIGEPVDPDIYTYKAPTGDQRLVKGIMGDNPLIKENASMLQSKLKKDYKRYVSEAELSRSNTGSASPLTANNRDDFDMDPFAGETPVTDGSRSPLSTVKRQRINK